MICPPRPCNVSPCLGQEMLPTPRWQWPGPRAGAWATNKITLSDDASRWRKYHRVSSDADCRQRDRGVTLVRRSEWPQHGQEGDQGHHGGDRHHDGGVRGDDRDGHTQHYFRSLYIVFDKNSTSVIPDLLNELLPPETEGITKEQDEEIMKAKQRQVRDYAIEHNLCNEMVKCNL